MDVGEPVVRALGALAPDELEAAYRRLGAEAGRTLGEQEIRYLRWLDGRYQGQTWETNGVPVPAGPLDDAAIDGLRGAFDATHRRTWGYAVPRADVMVRMARVTATVELGTPDAPALGDPGGGGVTTTRAYLDGRWRDVPIVAREALAAGATLAGPALVVQPTATTVLDAGDRLTVDPTGHLIITWERA